MKNFNRYAPSIVPRISWRLVSGWVLSCVLLFGVDHSILAQTSPTNAAIQSVQQLLIDDGYVIDTVDGLLGPQTINAIRQFQRANALPVDSDLDMRTIEAIETRLQRSSTAPDTFALPLEPASLERNDHALTNQELLEQATTTYQQEEAHFSAEQRHLQKIRVLYQQIEQANGTLAHHEALAADEAADHTDLASTEQRLARYQDVYRNIEQQLMVLEQRMKQNEAVQLSTDTFINAVHKLYPMILEMRLRLADGSLDAQDIPAFLSESALNEQQQRLETHKHRLSEAQAHNRARLSALQAHMDEVQGMVAAADKALVALQEQQEQASQRQRLEEAYQNKSNAELREELARLEDERISLQGAFRLALLRLNRAQADLDGLDAALEPLPAATSPVLGTDFTPAEAEDATQALQASISTFEARLSDLHRLQQKINDIQTLGQGFDTEAAILQEHLAKIQLLSDLIATRDPALAEELNIAAIAQRHAAIRQTIDDTTSALQTLSEQADILQTRQDEVRSAHLQAMQRLADVEQTLASVQQAQDWQQQLNALDGEALVARFISDAETLEAQHVRLEEQRNALDALLEQEAALREKGNIFSDPLVRLSQPEVQKERQRIQEMLYQLSGLDAPAEAQPVAASPETPPPPATGDDAADAQPAPETAASAAESDTSASTPFAADIQGLRAYQNLLSSRQQNAQTRAEERAQRLEVLASLEAVQTACIDQLSEVHRLALQQYATAVALKKQLGRGDLSPEQAPEGLIEALQKAPIEALEQELQTRLNHRAHMRLRLSRLQNAAPGQDERQALAEQLQSQVGQRLDLLAELQQLEAQRVQAQDTLEESERQRLEQQAENRLRAGSGWLESVLGFLPSERAEELTTLLRSKYHELVSAEAKQALLATEREKVAYLIQLVQDDQQAIKTFLPLLREQLQALEHEQERAWTRLRAQFNPDDAETLLADFAARTGEQLELAPPILEADRAAFVEDATGMLLGRHVQMLALQRWIARFEQRQRQTLVSEMAPYRDREGEISALDAALQRQVKRLLGHTQDELAARPDSQRPGTREARAYFLQGAIGVEHEQRTQARLRALMKVVLELVVIIALAWLVLYGVKRLVNRKVRELEMSGAPESTHTLFALSFGFAAFRILVVALAIMLALSSLGFDIGVILAGLGIGGFAIAIAAKETLSNLIGGITLFVERPFRIGDIVQINNDIKLGEAEVGRVEGVSWRTTRLVTLMNYHITMPNSRVAEAAIINHTHQMPLRDLVHVYVSPAYDVRKVLLLITSAVDECQLIRQDLQKQILAIGTEVVGEIVLTKYEVRWYTDISYLARARVLTEFWNRLWHKFHEAGVPLEYVMRRSLKEFTDEQ